jgi:hypothetical protein
MMAIARLMLSFNLDLVEGIGIAVIPAPLVCPLRPRGPAA